jgi:hypothetical protein
MANRMEIELTSARDDEFTWRAAGARQPRGSVSSSLLPPSSKVGDVLRAEVEVEIDGITVVAVLPPKGKATPEDRIEYIGPARPAPGVTTVLSGRGERKSRDARDSRGGRETRRREPSGDRPREPRAPTGDRRPSRGAQRPSREAEATRPGARRQPERKGPPRFEPGTAHRDELFATLTPEQRPIAERLAIGGMPGVRKALAEEQQRAKSEGRPVTSGEPIIALAEQLLPEVRAAVWLDRAEAAAGREDEITLRDLRTTVVGASPRDEAGKALERQLREALERRVTKLRADWEAHISQAIEEGRVLQALRLSAKPPEPTARFPGALASRLASVAGEAMTSEVAPERWLALLSGAVESPVRRQVKPAGLPADPSGEVERQARMAAGRIPALARLLGMPIPPPPRPTAGERRISVRPPRTARSRPPRSTGRKQPATASSEPNGVSEKSASDVPSASESRPLADDEVFSTVALPEEAPVSSPDEPEEATVSQETASQPQKGELDTAPSDDLLPESEPSAESAAEAEDEKMPEATSDEPVLGEEVSQALDEAQSS